MIGEGGAQGQSIVGAGLSDNYVAVDVTFFNQINLMNNDLKFRRHSGLWDLVGRE